MTTRFLATTLSALALASLAGCMTPPPDTDLSCSGQCRRRSSSSPCKPPAINQIHSWQVKLSTPDGAPVAHARINVDGGMPQHGHGLPTRPLVTRELADGTYLIEGMKFSMTGWWEIKLAIQTADAADR